MHAHFSFRCWAVCCCCCCILAFLGEKMSTWLISIARPVVDLHYISVRTLTHTSLVCVVCVCYTGSLVVAAVWFPAYASFTRSNFSFDWLCLHSLCSASAADKQNMPIWCGDQITTKQLWKPVFNFSFFSVCYTKLPFRHFSRAKISDASNNNKIPKTNALSSCNQEINCISRGWRMFTATDRFSLCVFGFGCSGGAGKHGMPSE